MKNGPSCDTAWSGACGLIAGRGWIAGSPNAGCVAALSWWNAVASQNAAAAWSAAHSALVAC